MPLSRAMQSIAVKIVAPVSFSMYWHAAPYCRRRHTCFSGTSGAFFHEPARSVFNAMASDGEHHVMHVIRLTLSKTELPADLVFPSIHVSALP
jgi:tRNA nucleotidyltransferase (CCA-adding enzyme)